VDDHAMFRQGIVRLFEKEPQFKIAGQYATAAKLSKSYPKAAQT
jgi:DNA-binding NarL/FixJ family response regulator